MPIHLYTYDKSLYMLYVYIYYTLLNEYKIIKELSARLVNPRVYHKSSLNKSIISAHASTHWVANKSYNDICFNVGTLSMKI